MEMALGNADRSAKRAFPRSAPGKSSKRSQPSECLAQWIEAERAQIERVPMECLQVEIGTLTPFRLFSGLHPDPLAHLVRGGLPRPAEVPLPFEAEYLVGHPGVRPEELP